MIWNNGITFTLPLSSLSVSFSSYTSKTSSLFFIPVLYFHWIHGKHKNKYSISSHHSIYSSSRIRTQTFFPPFPLIRINSKPSYLKSNDMFLLVNLICSGPIQEPHSCNSSPPATAFIIKLVFPVVPLSSDHQCTKVYILIQFPFNLELIHSFDRLLERMVYMECHNILFICWTDSKQTLVKISNHLYLVKPKV